MAEIDSKFESTVNYKKIVMRFLSYKKLYIYTVILFLIVAFLINKFSITYYKNSTKILISEHEQSFLTGSDDLFQGMNFLTGKNNIENEIEQLSTFSLIKQAIDNLDFKTSIFSYEKTLYSDYLENTKLIQKKELYDDSPIKVIIDVSEPQPTDLIFKIEFLDDTTKYRITTESENIYLYNYIDDLVVGYIPNNVILDKIYSFGDEVKSRYFNFTILKSDYYSKDYTSNRVLYFYFNNMNYLTSYYQSMLSIDQVSPTSSVVEVAMKGTNFNKITDFLNSLTGVFNEKNLEKKNTIAQSTVDFIDSQIEDVADSLSTTESQLKTFRTSNQVMDLSFQGQQIFNKISELESEKANLDVQKKYYQYLKNYFSEGEDVSNLMAPSSMGVVDPILTNLVSQLITLNSERASIMQGNSGSQSIYLRDLDIKINNLKNTIKENVENTLNTINISLNEINYRLSKHSSQIAQLPKTELQLKRIQRKFTVDDAIYTFLLQKRAEAQIARASSRPDYEIIEPARYFAIRVVSPKKKLNYILALFLGLIIPTSYILVIDFFNNKINEIEEIEKYTNKPLLGKVFRNFRRSTLIVFQKPNSSVSESFRALRTNFQFFDEGGKRQVILFTSSLSGDGKTFCAINFASVLALNGHRTALLEFDLRRPKIHQEFNSTNMIGISSYLIEKAIIDDIIIPTEIPNLDLISAGPAAPNPAELIASTKTTEFIEKLKEMYDYIVIDSAPVGIVSETYLLMKNTDLNIFVVRMNHTVKEAFKMAMKGLTNNHFENYSILVNDLNIRKESYKYGYDNKYYTDDKRRGLFGIFKRRKKSA